jgi:hypothetical protein
MDADPQRPDTPTWVKLVGLLALILVLGLGVLLLLGGHQGGLQMHEPRDHGPAASPAAQL